MARDKNWDAMVKRARASGRRKMQDGGPPQTKPNVPIERSVSRPDVDFKEVTAKELDPKTQKKLEKYAKVKPMSKPKIATGVVKRNIAKKVAKKALKKLGPIGVAYTVYDIAKDPKGALEQAKKDVKNVKKFIKSVPGRIKNIPKTISKAHQKGKQRIARQKANRKK